MVSNRLIALFRGARLVLHIAYGLVLAVAYPWFSIGLRRYILQNWSLNLLAIFNVRIDIDGNDPLHALRHGLIVTNHISWLDVFVLNAVVPMRFVAKSEVRRWPVIGWLCARAQTLFIERGKARSAARINVKLVELLERGECLAIFPEGTTTDGSGVAHFHSSLLQPAIDAGALVHPVAIRYQDASGRHSLAAAYIGEMSFGQSMWNILSTPELHVRLAATPPLDASGTERRNLTHAVHQHISKTLAELHANPLASLHIPTTYEHAHAHAENEVHFQSLYCVLLYPELTRKIANQSPN